MSEVGTFRRIASCVSLGRAFSLALLYLGCISSQLPVRPGQWRGEFTGGVLQHASFRARPGVFTSVVTERYILNILQFENFHFKFLMQVHSSYFWRQRLRIENKGTSLMTVPHVMVRR